ncbi:MAG TPA: sigma-70 family RNA polymerase sigma factor [Gemmataceae bacterium]|jgi:RNA polymerase sigma-70 factor (ECF subfamily)
MAINPMRKILQHLQRSAFPSDGAGLSDGQLLERYLHHREDAAFAALVRRHGPMVMNVCRRVLGNHHDAEDAFQASFLVLVRKAAAVVPRERVANFLYGVAHTTALRARGLIAKRRAREKQVAEMPEPEARPQELWDDLPPLLDRELSRLPDKYRIPIILCDLEDRPIKEAAKQLGWPQGTLAGRLARARVMLAKRLARHGLTVSGGALGLLLSQQARSALVPARLIGGTMEAARLFAAGQATPGLISAPVVALTEGVLKTMFLTKLKIATTVVMVAAAALSATGGFYQAVAGDTPRAETRPAERPPAPRQPVAAKTDVRPAQTDLDRLQGVWSVVSIESDGKPRKLEKAVFMVDGKRACWQTRDSEIQGGLYLNPSRAPKTYDLAMSTKTIEGIYSLDGDTLRLCYGFKEEGKRPTRFATKKGDQQVFVVLKRLHPGNVFPFRRADGTRAFPTLIEKENIPAQPPPTVRAPQPSQPAAADVPKATPPVETKSPHAGLPEAAAREEPHAKNELPDGPMPRQVLVRLEKGQLSVETPDVGYEPITVMPEGKNYSVTSYQAVYVRRTRHYRPDMLKVYDMKGKRIDAKQLPKLLKKETVALFASTEQAADPLNLRLFKEGTLLFVLPSGPTPPAPAVAIPPPGAAILPAPPTVEAEPSTPIPPPAPASPAPYAPPIRLAPREPAPASSPAESPRPIRRTVPKP